MFGKQFKPVLADQFSTLPPEALVRIRFQKHNAIGELHQEYKRVRSPAAEMQMHHAVIAQQRIAFWMTGRSAVEIIRNLVAGLYRQQQNFKIGFLARR